MRYLESLIGTAAAFCATISYVPQLEQRWETSEAGDLSLKMLNLLAAGLSLWMAYGFSPRVATDVVRARNV